MKTKLVVASVCALLALPASAFAATYGGSLKKGGRIGIGVSVEGGHPTHVKEVNFKKVPATCQSSAHRKVTGGIKYEDPGLNVQGGPSQRIGQARRREAGKWQKAKSRWSS